MNNYGLFMQFGIRAAGGPAFLKRTREAVSQLQTRSRTGTTTSQLQQRNGTCSCSSICYEAWANAGFDGTYMCPFGRCRECETTNILNCSGYSGCSYVSFCSNGGYEGDCGTKCVTYNGAGNDCDWYYWTNYQRYYGCSIVYGAWFNVSSCSAANIYCSNGCPSCNGATGARQCQTATVCSFGAWSEWTNTSSCTAATPACSNGAVQTECQTIYTWGDWSAYEEVDVCTPQSPALGAGAVEIECVPQ